MSITASTDPRSAPPAHDSLFDRWALTRLRDPRDLLFARKGLQISLTVLPSAALVFAVPTWAVPLLIVPHLLVVFVMWGGRYMLLLHAICHRTPFKKEHGWLNQYLQNFLGLFFGQSPMTFYAHHVGMHHPENNLEADQSCTLPYQRDRFTHFLHYWVRFAVFGDLHVPRYLRTHNRPKLYWNLVLGEFMWIGLVIAFGLWNPAATFVVLVLPFALIRWFLMCGNFAQHAFVDVDDAGNPYRNSTCLTETVYNHRAYNDGYHIVHHIKPTLHWTEMAQWYEDNKSEFARQDAVVFSGIRNNQQVWWLLMTGNYGVLADHLVDFHGRTRDERIAFLQDRVRRTRGSFPALWA